MEGGRFWFEESGWEFGIIVSPDADVAGTHDQELVALLREGDEAAFRELVRQFQGRLARLARSFCKNEAVIEEAVQETWLAVIKGIHGFEGRAPLQSWIFSILGEPGPEAWRARTEARSCR